MRVSFGIRSVVPLRPHHEDRNIAGVGEENPDVNKIAKKGWRIYSSQGRNETILLFRVELRRFGS